MLGREFPARDTDMHTCRLSHGHHSTCTELSQAYLYWDGAGAVAISAKENST